MVLEFFMLGSFAYFLLAGIFGCVLLINCHDKNFGGATAVTFMFLCLWFLFGDLWPVVGKYSRWLPYLTLGYFFLGFLWALLRWGYRLHWLRRRYLQEFDVFKHDRDLKDSTTPLQLAENDRRAWSSRVHSQFNAYGMRYEVSGVFYPPNFSDNFNEIAVWLCFWPFSLIAAVVRDWCKYLLTKIVELFKDVFQSISRWVFRDFNA